MFVPGRVFDLGDWLADAVGAAWGALFPPGGSRLRA
jgi:VanZ family protein